VDLETDLRRQFPVLRDVAYLNAGTCGPLPAAARGARDDVADLGERDGRRGPYFERMLALQTVQREGYARLVGAAPEDVALTTSTSEGIVRVLAGLELGAGDEVVTSDAEHPGLLGPLVAAQRRFGIEVRAVPLAQVADAVGPRTRLVACSHVGWRSGDLAPAALAEVDVPVLLDGAQGAGAVPIDVAALGCDFYAAAGQKWLCGPVGTGLLYVAPAWHDALAPMGPTYPNFTGFAAPMDEWELHLGGRRHDSFAIAPELTAAAVAAFELLDGFGWDAVLTRAADQAERLAQRLAERGFTVAPRGRTTLVAWHDADPPATVARLAQERIAIRDLPGTDLLRASVGAWNDDSDLDRLLAALAAPTAA
jgi:L-cysteine/cystine lyase